MQHHRSIGLTDLVALMAAHRSVGRRQGLLDPHEAARIAACLDRDDPVPAPAAPAPPLPARHGAWPREAHRA